MSKLREWAKNGILNIRLENSTDHNKTEFIEFSSLHLLSQQKQIFQSV